MNHPTVAIEAAASGVSGNIWLPSVILAQLYLVFLVYLAWSARYLPNPVASQFGFLGRARGYMSRTVYTIFIGVFGTVFPLFFLVIHFVTVAHPESVHVAHGDYWLSPEHIPETKAYMLQHWLWFACLLTAFMGGVHFTVVRANRRQPPRLPWAIFVPLLAAFLGCVIWWSISIDQHFKNAFPGARQPSALQFPKFHPTAQAESQRGVS